MRPPRTVVSIRAGLACALALGLIGLGPRAVLAEPAPVPAADMAAYEKGFSAVQQNSRSFQADLRQTLFLQGVTKPIVSLGTLYFQAPDRLLIRFSQPAGEWMIVNGSQMVIQKQGRPLQHRDMAGPGKSRSQAASLLDFFHSGAARWHKDFDVSMTRDGNLLHVQLKPYLTPTSPDQGVQQIVTTLKLPAYDLADMQISINAANRIEYQFTNGHRNIPLDPALFQIPP